MLNIQLKFIDKAQHHPPPSTQPQSTENQKANLATKLKLYIPNCKIEKALI